MKKIILGIIISTNLFGYIQEIEKEEIVLKALREQYNPKIVKYIEKHLKENENIKILAYGIYKENEYAYYRDYLYIAENTEDLELKLACYEKIIKMSEEFEVEEEKKWQIEIIKKNYELEKEFLRMTK